MEFGFIAACQGEMIQPDAERIEDIARGRRGLGSFHGDDGRSRLEDEDGFGAQDGEPEHGAVEMAGSGKIPAAQADMVETGSVENLGHSGKITLDFDERRSRGWFSAGPGGIAPA